MKCDSSPCFTSGGPKKLVYFPAATALRLRLRRLCTNTAAALLVSVAALQAVRAEDDAALDEVVVTATKRETKLLETPISMTVLGADVLQAVDADDFSDYERLIPGLTAIDSGPGQKRYALRGLQSAGEPEVALYHDEIPISGLPGGSLDTGDSQPDLKLFDVDRIEVLRGPQGTLYGNGSMGGAIRIISKRPDLQTYSAHTDLGGAVTEGGAPSLRTSALVNIPVIAGRLALRLDGYYRHDGGWIDDLYRSDIKLPQLDSNNLNWEANPRRSRFCRVPGNRPVEHHGDYILSAPRDRELVRDLSVLCIIRESVCVQGVRADALARRDSHGKHHLDLRSGLGESGCYGLVPATHGRSEH